MKLQVLKCFNNTIPSDVLFIRPLAEPRWSWQWSCWKTRIRGLQRVLQFKRLGHYVHWSTFPIHLQFSFHGIWHISFVVWKHVNKVSIINGVCIPSRLLWVFIQNLRQMDFLILAQSLHTYWMSNYRPSAVCQEKLDKYTKSWPLISQRVIR